MCPFQLTNSFEISVRIDHMDQTAANSIEGVIGIQENGSAEDFQHDQQLTASKNCYGLVTKSCEKIKLMNNF